MVVVKVGTRDVSDIRRVDADARQLTDSILSMAHVEPVGAERVLSIQPAH